MPAACRNTHPSLASCRAVRCSVYLRPQPLFRTRRNSPRFAPPTYPGGPRTPPVIEPASVRAAAQDSINGGTTHICTTGKHRRKSDNSVAAAERGRTLNSRLRPLIDSRRFRTTRVLKTGWGVRAASCACLHDGQSGERQEVGDRIQTQFRENQDVQLLSSNGRRARG